MLSRRKRWFMESLTGLWANVKLLKPDHRTKLHELWSSCSSQLPPIIHAGSDKQTSCSSISFYSVRLFLFLLPTMHLTLRIRSVSPLYEVSILINLPSMQFVVMWSNPSAAQRLSERRYTNLCLFHLYSYRLSWTTRGSSLHPSCSLTASPSVWKQTHHYSVYSRLSCFSVSSCKTIIETQNNVICVSKRLKTPKVKSLFIMFLCCFLPFHPKKVCHSESEHTLPSCWKHTHMVPVVLI